MISMTAPTPLLIYVNSDVAMERPFRVSLPASVDTLAELCHFLAARLPLRPGEDSTGRGHRFLYSLTGRPLWRVKECIDARSIVASVGPGFLPRRPAALAAAAERMAIEDVTPDHPAVRVDQVNDSGCGASSSASPPIKSPAVQVIDRRSNGGSGGDAFAALASSGRAAVDGASPIETGRRHSAGLRGPTGNSTGRPAHDEEYERLLSITLNTAMRGVSSAEYGDGGRPRLSPLLPTPPTGVKAATEASESTPAQGFLASSPEHQPTFLSGASAPSLVPQEALPRGAVRIGEAVYPLPPRPHYNRAATCSTMTVDSLAPQLQPIPSTSYSSDLSHLLMRKWAAFRCLHAAFPADLIAGEALAHLCGDMAAKSLNNGRLCRVMVSGPPRSGVSTTAALVVRHLLHTAHAPQSQSLSNSLLICLDFELLLGSGVQTSTLAAPQPPPRLLRDLTSFYQVVIRAVVDAVVAQRPALRDAGTLLSQLWDLVLQPHAASSLPPDFTSYHQAVAFLGVDILASWTRLVKGIYPILQAACHTPEVPELRTSALDLILYAIPAELASSLEFSGLFYVVDGASALSRCYADRVTRPAGDFGSLLHAITADPRTQLVVAWPSSLPPQSLYLPGMGAHISTVGLLSRAVLNTQHFPQFLHCRDQTYSLEIFLGCPGYLSPLAALLRPFRKTLSIPTTAFSTVYQQHYERSGAAEKEGYAVRLDTDGASRVLKELWQLVQTLPLS